MPRSATSNVRTELQHILPKATHNASLQITIAALSPPASSSSSSKRPRPSSPTSFNEASSTSASSSATPSKRSTTASTISSSSSATMTTANHEKAHHLHLQLTQEWSKGASADLNTLKSLLVALKIELSELGLLFPALDEKTKSNVGGLTTARDILEVGAFVSIRSQDVPSFERYLNLLNTYYGDLSKSIPSSINEAALLALSLLRLLSQNRIAEFHTLLETLSKDIVSSTDVQWAINLERSLMEGSYSRVWQLCSNSQSLPRPEFAFFVSTLVGTVRNEIASCQERSYATLPLSNARTLLFFNEENEVVAFATARGWHIASNIIHFAASPLLQQNGIPSSLTVGMEGKELDKEKVVRATLGYARELETIV